MMTARQIEKSELIQQKGRPYIDIPKSNDYLIDEDEEKIDLYNCGERIYGGCRNLIPLKLSEVIDMNSRRALPLCHNCSNVHNVEDSGIVDKEFGDVARDINIRLSEMTYQIRPGLYVGFIYHSDDDCYNGDAQHKFYILITNNTYKYIDYYIQEQPNDTRSSKIEFDSKIYQYRKKKKMYGSLAVSGDRCGFDVPFFQEKFKGSKRKQIAILTKNCRRLNERFFKQSEFVKQCCSTSWAGSEVSFVKDPAYYGYYSGSSAY